MRALIGLLVIALAGVPAAAHDWNGIAIDARDNVFVVDAEDGQVWKIDPQGAVSVFRKGIEDRKTCPHTHHVAVDKHGTVWLPSG